MSVRTEDSHPRSIAKAVSWRITGSVDKRQGNMHIELTVDAMELARHVDQMVLFSGDGDFYSLVEAVQRRGVRVTVVSTISSEPPMIADELRRQADAFIDLIELKPRIARGQSEQRAREPRYQTSAAT